MASCFTCFTILIVFEYCANSSALGNFGFHGKSMVGENADVGILSSERFPRQAGETTSYDEILKSKPVPENANSNKVLYDFNSLSFQNYAASSYVFRVILTPDSVPPVGHLFTVDGSRQLRINSSLSNTERKKFFDYEQYPIIVVIAEATRDSDKKGLRE